MRGQYFEDRYFVDRHVPLHPDKDEPGTHEHRYFGSKGTSSKLTVSHNTTEPGTNPDRAIYMSISGYGKSSTMALSVDDAQELRGALKELLDEAAPRKLFVVDTTFGAFSTYARSKPQARANAQVWVDGYSKRGSVGTRIWEVVR